MNRSLLSSLLPLVLCTVLGCYPFDTPPPGELPPASDQEFATVEPLYAWEELQFRELNVVAHFPEEPPTAMAFVFHGTQGSAKIAHKIEVVDVLNDLVAAGVGFVAYESQDRVDTLRWEVDSVEPEENRDLDNLFALREHLVMEQGKFQFETPLVALGMSNGASFTGVFGRAAKEAGWPIRALSLHCGPVVEAVREGEGLQVPTFFVIAANDSVVNNDHIRSHHVAMPEGIATELHEAREVALPQGRFVRIGEEIDESDSRAIFHELRGAGVVDEDGVRLVGIPGEAEEVLRNITLSDDDEDFSQQVKNQLQVVWAEHTFSADFKDEEVGFLLEQLEAE